MVVVLCVVVVVVLLLLLLLVLRLRLVFFCRHPPTASTEPALPPSPFLDIHEHLGRSTAREGGSR